MDKYDYQKWINKRLKNGRTVAEEMKYVDVDWRDDKGIYHTKENPTIQKAIEYAKSLNLEKVTFLTFFYHSHDLGYWKNDLNYK